MANVKTNQKEAMATLKKCLETLGFDLQQEISLCLSDLPRDHMTKGNNGKLYMNLTIAMRKEPDQWGRDLKVYVTPTKKDKENHSAKVYVGGGKTFIFAENQSASPTDDEINAIIPPPEANEKSDLPF